MSDSSFELPGDDERITLYGMTGSGKTVAALWHLSQRDIGRKPWLILDWKGDENIAMIDRAQPIEPGEVPTKPGVHVMRPVAEYDDEAVDKTLYGVHQHGGIGVYIDEAYMVPKGSKPFRALLTQGRSLRIPMIVLSQRPLWMDRFAISEANYHQIFFLADERDRDVVQRFIPYDVTERRLPRWHSYYYDIARDDFTGLKPLPPPEQSVEQINAKLRTRTKLI